VVLFACFECDGAVECNCAVCLLVQGEEGMQGQDAGKGWWMGKGAPGKGFGGKGYPMPLYPMGPMGKGMMGVQAALGLQPS